MPTPTRLQALEEFYQAIKSLWRWQGILGRAHQRGAPLAVRRQIDPHVKAAMERVEKADDMLMGKPCSLP